MVASHNLWKKRLHAIVSIGLLMGCGWLIAGCSEKQAAKKDAAKMAVESKTERGIKDARCWIVP